MDQISGFSQNNHCTIICSATSIAINKQIEPTWNPITFIAKWLRYEVIDRTSALVNDLAQCLFRERNAESLAINTNHTFTKFNLRPTPSTFSRLFFKNTEAEQQEIQDCEEHLSHSHEVGKHLELLGNVSAADWEELSQAEVLAKVLAYRDLTQVQTLSLPRKIEGVEEPQISKHRIEKIDLGSNLFAYGLTPLESDSQEQNQTISPILLFRGTAPWPSAEGAFATINAGVDPSGVAWSLFQNRPPALNAWLENNTTADNKAIVTGHSAGGALTNYTATFLPQYIKKGYTFNSTGVNSETKHAWEALTERPELKGYVTQSDFIPYLGEHIIGETHEVRTHDKPWWFVNIRKTHNRLAFNRPLWSVHHIDNTESEQCRMRSVCCTIQNIVTGGLEYIGAFYRGVKKGLFEINNIVYNKMAAKAHSVASLFMTRAPAVAVSA